jgi:hypothetical protein
MTDSWRQILQQAASNLSVDLAGRGSSPLGGQGPAPAAHETGRDFEGRRRLERDLAMTGRAQSVSRAHELSAVSSSGTAAYAVSPPFGQTPAPDSDPRGTSWRNLAAVSFSGAILTLTGYAFLKQANTSVREVQASASPVQTFDEAQEGARYLPARTEMGSAPATQPPTDLPGPATSAETAKHHDVPSTVAAPKATISALQPATQKIFLETASNQLSAGDIEGARETYELLAQHNSAEGAFDLAETYDPNVLSMHLVKGFEPNASLARQWYEKAAALGSSDASVRLERLN